MAAQSSEPSERDPGGGVVAVRGLGAHALLGAAAEFGAMSLALMGQLAAAGALLLASALEVGRGRRLELASDSTTSRLRPFLDLGVIAAVIAGQTLGASRSALHGPGP